MPHFQVLGVKTSTYLLGAHDSIHNIVIRFGWRKDVEGSGGQQKTAYVSVGCLAQFLDWVGAQ